MENVSDAEHKAAVGRGLGARSGRRRERRVGAHRFVRPDPVTWHRFPASRKFLPTSDRAAPACPKSGSTLLRPPKRARAKARARYRSERLENAAAGAEMLWCSRS